MISSLENLTEIFSKMNADGMDTSKTLKGGFYFIDEEKENLQKLYEEMKDHGYKFEEIRELDEHEWMIYVSKEDILNPEKLHKRNIAFNELSEYCAVSLYDGWDVPHA